MSCFFTDALAALTGPARNVRFGYNGGGDDCYDDDDDYDVKIDDSDIIIIFASATAAHEICESFRRTALKLQYFYR